MEGPAHQTVAPPGMSDHSCLEACHGHSSNNELMNVQRKIMWQRTFIVLPQ